MQKSYSRIDAPHFESGDAVAAADDAADAGGFEFGVGAPAAHTYPHPPF